MFFVDAQGERFSSAQFIHSHQETTFSVAALDGRLVICLDPAPAKPDPSLLRLAEEAVDWDYFDGRYLSFDGADPDYGYTFQEIAALRGRQPTVVVQDGQVLIELSGIDAPNELKD